MSCYGPEGCLTVMIKNMPDIAKSLLDRCVTTKGSKDHPDSYQVMYDFFCLESKGMVEAQVLLTKSILVKPIVLFRSVAVDILSTQG